MSHLAPSELLDVAESSPLPAALQTHLESCAVCRGKAARLGATLDATRQIDIPEPSPLFWERLSDRVRGAIEVEPPHPRSGDWLQWPVLVPGTGLALVVLALVSTLTPGRNASVENGGAAVALDSASDSEWDLVADLVGPIDFETAREAGLAPAPGAADRAVLQLSAAERQELVRLLRLELRQPGG